MRQFIGSLTLSLISIPENTNRLGRASTVIHCKSVPHLLTGSDKTSKKRKKRHGCYEQLSINENCYFSRNSETMKQVYCNIQIYLLYTTYTINIFGSIVMANQAMTDY